MPSAPAQWPEAVIIVSMFKSTQWLLVPAKKISRFVIFSSFFIQAHKRRHISCFTASWWFPLVAAAHGWVFLSFFSVRVFVDEVLLWDTALSRLVSRLFVFLNQTLAPQQGPPLSTEHTHCVKCRLCVFGATHGLNPTTFLHLLIPSASGSDLKRPVVFCLTITPRSTDEYLKD